MRLNDIFSCAIFGSAEERKAADLKNLDRWLARLAEDRLEIMLENAMEKADNDDTEPEPVRIDKIFRHLKPEDITRAVLKKSGGMDFMEYLAECEDMQLTMTVTPEKPSWFWRGDDTAGVKLSIIIDMNKGFDESRILLPEEPASPAPSAPKPLNKTAAP